MRMTLYNPTRAQFCEVDAGQVGTETLLINILIELRVQSLMIQQQAGQLAADDLDQLRCDIVNDPKTFTPVTAL